MKKSVLIPIVFTILMWVINSIQFLLHLDFGGLGIHPRDSQSLIGIITSPLIHGNWEHLISNTLPILILGVLLFLTHEKTAIWIWLLNYIFTGLLVWLFARDSYHIGASGIIYGLASFLLFSGFFRMDIKAIAIASGVAILYGGLVWGMLPGKTGISWESHLFGGIVGFILAFIFRNSNTEELNRQNENETSNKKTFEDYLNQR